MKPWHSKLGDVIPGALAVWVLVLLVPVWLGRVVYGFDLEWMEGGMLAHAHRIQQGLPLYAPPSAEWIPYIYPPGYSALVAGLGSVFGLDYPLGRGLSLLGIIGASAALVFGVSRHSRDMVAGLCGAAVFLAMYPESGAFYDLVRPDGLAIGLLGWALVLAGEERREAWVASGLLLALAFTVKHNFASFGVPIALGLWAWRGWRAGLVFGLASAVPALMFTGWMQYRSGGEFLVYLLEVPGVHPMVSDRLWPGSLREVSKPLWPAFLGLGALATAWAAREVDSKYRAALVGSFVVEALLLAGWVHDWTAPRAVGNNIANWKVGLTAVGLALGVSSVVVVAGRRAVQRDLGGRWVMAAGLALTAVVTAVLMRGHNGGFTNVFIPLHWCVSAGLALGVAELRARAPLWVGGALGSVWLAAQLYVAIPDVGGLVPTEEDEAIGLQFVEAIADHCGEGPVLSMHGPWLVAQAGLEPGLHQIALWDVAYKKGPYPRSQGVVARAVREQRYTCVIDATKRLKLGVPERYRQVWAPDIPRRSEPTGRAPFVPRTGWPVRPRAILVPKGKRHTSN